MCLCACERDLCAAQPNIGGFPCFMVAAFRDIVKGESLIADFQPYLEKGSIWDGYKECLKDQRLIRERVEAAVSKDIGEEFRFSEL